MPEVRPRVIAWEVTRRCNLHCQHCRGAARDAAYEGELSTDECLEVIDGLGRYVTRLPAHHAGPALVLILTGGEPMMRDDIFDLARRAADAGLFVVMAPCGHLLTSDAARRLTQAGVKAISISIDAATPEEHDAFRGVAGAFDRTLEGLKAAVAAGIPFQVNTTVTSRNVEQLERIHALAGELSAFKWDVFFLVPTGRGAALADLALSAPEAEAALRQLHALEQQGRPRIKVTCAPQSVRVWQQLGSATDDGSVTGRKSAATGCMAGTGFAFISHTGELQPCGFLDVPAGNLRDHGLDFDAASGASRVFADLRDHSRFKGKCGACEFLTTCGGCRARAFAATGDFLSPEPGCPHIPAEGAA